jgi:hypothetical protein
MGVLAMIFGGVQILFTGVSLIGQSFSKQMMGSMGKAVSGLPHPEGQPDMGEAFERLAHLTDELKLYTYLTGFTMLAFAVTLILVGWMLYKRRAQARPLTIAWAAAALAYLPVQLWIQVKIILPRTQEVTKAFVQGMDQAAAGIMDSVSGMQGMMTVIGYVAFYTPFPILLLVLIGRQSAKNDLLPASIS